MGSSVQKLEGYSKRLHHEWRMWRGRRQEARRHRLYDRWMVSMLENPPDVLIGPDLPYGGVRGHIRAIARYSSLKVEVVPNEKAIGGLDQFTASLRERFLGFQPGGNQVVHSHVIPWYISWCREQQKRGLPWVHTYHLPYFPEHGENGVLKPDQVEINEALLEVARHADIRLSVAKWQCEYLRKHHGIAAEYLPNGVDVAACDRGDPERFRRRTGIDRPFVLYVGRNDPVKNPAEFVRLARQRPDLRFVAIGQWLDAEVMRRDWQVESPANLLYLGTASHAGVQDALAACEVLVVTSKREGLPTLVMEGMAHGKPVVVPNEAGCMEAVHDGAAGHVYELGSLTDLDAKLNQALGDSEIGAAGRQRVMDEYAWRVVALKLDSIYRSNE